jgi:hypothetical protein
MFLHVIPLKTASADLMLLHFDYKRTSNNYIVIIQSSDYVGMQWRTLNQIFGGAKLPDDKQNIGVTNYTVKNRICSTYRSLIELVQIRWRNTCLPWICMLK